MSRKDIIKRQVIEGIADQTRKTIKNLTREQIEDLYIQSEIKRRAQKEINRILMNAVFTAHSEQIKLPLFKEETGIPCDVDQAVEEFREKQLESREITEEYYKERIEALDKKLKALSAPGRSVSKPRKSRKPKQADKTVIYEVKDAVCPVCGKPLTHAGYKSKWQVAYQPGIVTFIEEKFETAVCPHHCDDEDGKSIIQTAIKDEPDLIDKSPATESLVAGIAYEKFIMGTPLYRLEKNLDRFNTPLSRQTMVNMTQYCFENYLKPLCLKIRSDLRDLNTVHMDETVLNCLELKDRTNSYMVCAVSGRHEKKQMAYFEFFPGRSQTFVPEVLGTGFSNALMSDGLKAYSNYLPATHLSCMAHARREFYEAVSVRDDYAQLLKILKSKEPDTADKALDFLSEHEALDILIDVLRLIHDLYKVEDNFYEDPIEVIQKARDEISRKTFDQLVSQVRMIHEGFEEGTRPYNAAAYFLNRQDELSRYLENGEWPIDNNLAERKIKTFVLARKNFLFSNSVKGAHCAAGYMTLLISAEMNKLNPFKYLSYILGKLKYYKDKDIPEEVLEELTPYSDQLPKELYIE